MPSPDHEAFRADLRAWCRIHDHEPGVAAQLSRYREALAILWDMDLAPAQPVL